MRASMFNIFDFSDDSKNFHIEFYAGNILDVASDVLIISSFVDSYAPSANTIFGSINRRYKLNFSKKEEEWRDLIDEHLYYFGSYKNKSFNDLYVIEMKDYENRRKFSLSDLKVRLKTINENRKSIVKENQRTLSMPLFGTGDQRLNKVEVAEELYSLALSFKDTSIEVVRIVVNTFEAISAINMKFNNLLKRKVTNKDSELLKVVIEDLKYHIDTMDVFKKKLKTMMDLINAENKAYSAIAIEGRRLAERFVNDYSAFYKIDVIGQNLEGKIKTITYPLKHNNYNHILSYLRLLQAYGNLAAHVADINFMDHDAIAIIISILRIFVFGQEQGIYK